MSTAVFILKIYIFLAEEDGNDRMIYLCLISCDAVN